MGFPPWKTFHPYIRLFPAEPTNGNCFPNCPEERIRVPASAVAASIVATDLETALIF
jgi:hypothetical protein